MAVAVKLEYADCPRPQLKYEAKIYEKLGSIPEGFIEIYYFGPYGRQFYALCMELLGPDLDDLYCKKNKKKLPLFATPSLPTDSFANRSINVIFRRCLQ